MSDELKWNYEEFTTYLLLYASSADLEITADEVALIKKRISDAQYDSIKADFDKANDFERLQTIINYKGLYFPTAVQARELIDMVNKLFNVDGNFSTLEQNSMKLLKRLI